MKSLMNPIGIPICRPIQSRLSLTLLIASLLFGTFPSSSVAEPKYQRPVLIRMEGPIFPLTQQFIERKLEQAREMQADLVIIEIDSPGGLVDPSFGIAETLRDIQWATTVAYIPREALSGAAFVALGCEKIVLSPKARLGDAGPIVLGDDSMFRHAPEKIVSDLAVRIRQIAEARNRNPGLVEAMVKQDLQVFNVTHRDTGEKTFLTETEIQDASEPEAWLKGKPVFESRDGHFLEVTGDRAVELGLADANVDNFEALQANLGLDRPPIRLAYTWVDSLVRFLNFPAVTILLLLIGMVCLYVEISIPGIGIAGITSGICFGVFFWSRFLGGTAGWLEILLFLLGVACLAMELFVIPGFGVMGISGILLIVSSFVLASQTFVVPHTTADFFAVGRSLRDVAVVIGLFAASAVFLSRYFEHLPFLGAMVLKPDEDEVDPFVNQPSAETSLHLVGAKGVAKTQLRPSGKVRLTDGRVLDVVAEGSFVDVNRPVEVIFVQGNRINVRELES